MKKLYEVGEEKVQVSHPYKRKRNATQTDNTSEISEERERDLSWINRREKKEKMWKFMNGKKARKKLGIGTEEGKYIKKDTKKSMVTNPSKET